MVVIILTERYLLGFFVVFMAVGAYVNALMTEEKIIYTGDPNLVVYESEITGIVEDIDNGKILVKSIKDYEVVYEEALVEITKKTIVKNYNKESSIKKGDLVSVNFLNGVSDSDPIEAVAKMIIVYATPLCLKDTNIKEISLDEFQNLEKGMTYRHIVNLLGSTREVGGNRNVLEYSIDGEQILIPFEIIKNICEYSPEELIGFK